MNETTVTLLPIETAARYPEAYCREHFPLRYARSLRFRLEADRLRCRAAGILLWEVLGAEEASLAETAEGKRFLPGSDRQFNLTHAGSTAALAVSPLPVGVDLEPCSTEHLEVARKVFTEEERRWMAAQPEIRFSQLWTMKEAVSKAFGLGLGLPFRAFSVLGLLDGKELLYEGQRLFGENRLIDGYSLSVCTVGERLPVTVRRFEEEPK